VVISFINEVSIWSIKDLKKSHTFDLSDLGKVDYVVMNPERNYIAIATLGIGDNDDRIVKVFDMSTRK
jgi:hypothetical protein